MAGSFYYFAYGSNLLPARLRLANKSATKVSNGILPGYMIVFANYSNFWKGGAATIIKDDESYVMGVVYELSQEDAASLDAQESGYDAIQVDIETGRGQRMKCKTYTMKEELSVKLTLPSLSYKNVIIAGAKENKFSEEYVTLLNNIESNGNEDAELQYLLNER
ncbi:Gamma-glutamylcyclotransferase [Halotydeus destructor]|nr:Gamma-glutamylcyclotransferase [Halotydeus destructor]